MSFSRVERAARMAAVEGEKVEKEKVLPKDAQVLLIYLFLLYILGDGGHP